MRLLVIGGTSFVGRTIVGDALGRGHGVTTFNRGLTSEDIDGVEALRGDRSTDEGVRPLAGRGFDAVIDPGGLVPAHVLRTARAVAESAPFYAFVSTQASTRPGTPLRWTSRPPPGPARRTRTVTRPTSRS